MAEGKVNINPSITIQKFKEAGGADPHNLEYNQKKNGELLEACVDMLYFATDGNLWGGPSISATNPKSPAFPNGCTISFIPVPLDFEGEERVGVFTFSKDMDNPAAVSTLGIKCNLTDKGHVDLIGRTSTTGFHSQNQLLQGISGLAVGVLSQKAES